MIKKRGNRIEGWRTLSETVHQHLPEATGRERIRQWKQTVECASGGQSDWVELANFNLAKLGCVQPVKFGGKNMGQGGRTFFCDITESFLVDADSDGDGYFDLNQAFMFSISCLDNLDTPDVNEARFCPLSSLIWGYR